MIYRKKQRCEQKSNTICECSQSALCFLNMSSSLSKSIWFEVRANVLNILNAFDKVWHEGLLFKLERIGISGNLLSLLKSFFK